LLLDGLLIQQKEGIAGTSELDNKIQGSGQGRIMTMAGVYRLFIAGGWAMTTLR
jgi:hypothetical protein